MHGLLISLPSCVVRRCDILSFILLMFTSTRSTEITITQVFWSFHGYSDSKNDLQETPETSQYHQTRYLEYDFTVTNDTRKQRIWSSKIIWKFQYKQRPNRFFIFNLKENTTFNPFEIFWKDAHVSPTFLIRASLFKEQLSFWIRGTGSSTVQEIRINV